MERIIKEDMIMKKMISSIKTLAALLMAGAAFTACSSSDDIIEQPINPTEPQVYTMVIKATRDSNASTRAVGLDGEKLVANWAGTEYIEVFQDNYGNLELIGTATAAASTDGTTTITATITTAPSESNTLFFYLYGINKDYTGQDGTLETISSKYAYAFGIIGSGYWSYDGNTITSTGTLHFLPMGDIIKFNLKDKSGTNDINATSLTFHDCNNESKLAQVYNGSTDPDPAVQMTYGDITINLTLATNTIYANLCAFEPVNLLMIAKDESDNIYAYTKVDFATSSAYRQITVNMHQLTGLNGSNAMAVVGGGLKEISNDAAKELAKAQWQILQSGTVYVVYRIASGRVFYASTSDGTNVDQDYVSIGNASDLYAAGSTAWFVEP
jgi:hypothetical protein